MESTGNEPQTLAGSRKIITEFESAQKLIWRWDSTSNESARERMIFEGDKTEAERYLLAVDEILRSVDTVRDTNTIQIAMSRLEDEFRNILISHCSAPESDLLVDLNCLSFSSSKEDEDTDEVEESTSTTEDKEGSRTSYRSMISFKESELIPLDAMQDLGKIAERMISAGYLRECVQVYGNVRKAVVDLSLRQLGIGKLSIGDVQRLEWDALENKIRRWIRASKICVRAVFANEKRICEHIFYGLTDDSCFMETVKGAAIQLFNFAEAISISKRSPEKLFKILDLYDTLSELLPDVASIFCSKSSVSVYIQAEEILSRLAEAARGILSEFENAVQRESSKIPVPGGTIHPLTRYVMNYISLLSDYRDTLLNIIISQPSTGFRFSGDLSLESDFQEFFESEERNTLAIHLIWIVINLQRNLENKSKLYKDNSLSHLFLMNNTHYIVQKVRGSEELRVLIGDEYLRNLTGKFRQSATNYQRSTWVRILHCLRDEGIHVSGGFSSGISKSTLKDRFKTFNSAFQEAHHTQSAWIVPDSQLREELRISVSEKILPAYRSFLGRFRHHLENGRHPEQYIKYTSEDIECALLDFFEGITGSLNYRRKPN